MTIDYDFDDDGSIEPQSTAALEIDPSGMTVVLPANVLYQVCESVAARVEHSVRSRIDSMVGKRIEALVSEAFDRSVTDIAEKAVADYLTKPRQKTNSWGEVLPGASTTMSELIPAKVQSWLEDKVSARDGSRVDPYQRNDSPTRFEYILNKHVRDELTAETKAAASRVTEEAKKVVSASVGRFIADQLVPQIDIAKR